MEIKKHAYLIIANKNPDQLQKLINELDDLRNDIYLLIDKKSKISEFELNLKYSNLILLDRKSIFWGSYSLIEAELSLFKESSKVGYEHYHLLSGLDFPLVSQNKIHNFFEKNPGKIFLTYSNALSNKELANRTKKYSFTEHFRIQSQNLIVKLFWSIFRRIERKTLIFQKPRVPVDIIGFASNWVSIDHEFILKVIENEHWIYTQFNDGYLVDELFIPTLVNKLGMNSKVFYNVPVSDKPEEFQGNLRYINWWQGSPYTWKIHSINDLKFAAERGHFFSRKFDEDVDDEIIDEVITQLINKN